MMLQLISLSFSGGSIEYEAIIYMARIQNAKYEFVCLYRIICVGKLGMHLDPLGCVNFAKKFVCYLSITNACMSKNLAVIYHSNNTSSYT